MVNCVYFVSRGTRNATMYEAKLELFLDTAVCFMWETEELRLGLELGQLSSHKHRTRVAHCIVLLCIALFFYDS